MNNFKGKYDFTRILLHIAFWITYVLGLAFVFSYGTSRTFFDSFMNVIFDLPTYLVLTYFTNYFTLPYLIKRKKFVNGFGILLLSIFILSIVNIYFSNLYFYLFDKIYHFKYSIKVISLNTVWNLSPLAIFTTIKFLRDYKKSEEEKASLLIRKQKAEVNRLRTRLYPQFLFSSLKHLEELSEQNLKSTAEGIARLSEILSYVLYDSDAKSISVKKEFKIVESYIELIAEQSDIFIYTEDLPYDDVSGRKILPGQIMPFLDQIIQSFGTSPVNKEIVVSFDTTQECIIIQTEIKDITLDQAREQIEKLEKQYNLLELSGGTLVSDWESDNLLINLNLIYV